MSATAIVLMIFGLALVVNVCLTAALLTLGLKWARADDVSFYASLKVSLVLKCAMAFITGVFLYTSTIGDTAFYDDLFALVAQVFVIVFAVKMSFGTSMLRTIQAIIPLVLSPIVMSGIMLLLIKPLVGETFVVPTGSMAPTILGEHIVTTCDQCTETAYFSLPRKKLDSGDSLARICERFHADYAQGRGPRQSGDRIYSARFVVPERWDIAVFKSPSNPNSIYAMRVVGLPGESIYIENGSVFVNGTISHPPEDISEIFYSEKSGRRSILNGTKENPAVLGTDEFFVLGDNTERSLDSRYWNEGAPGHNRFAVPRSHFSGVVTMIYWPPNRWRSFK